MIKNILKQITPPYVWNNAQRLRNRFHAYSTPGNDKRCRYLERIYRKNNNGLKADTIVIRPGIKMQIHPDTRNSFEHFCYISPEMVDEMDMFLEVTKGKHRLLDIGTLHGIFSLAFANQSTDRKALAIDASPIAFARLLYNINKNSMTNITPIECAISDRIGNLTMHYEWEHTVAAGTNSTDSTIDVPMTTGDILCQSEMFYPDVIKIDVEGHEIKVLKGLSNIIKENSPLIFLEVHPERIAQERDSLIFLENFFNEFGYSAQLMSGEPFQLSSFKKIGSDERILLSVA